MNKLIKILVIEDDPYICDLLTLYIEKSGYIVNVARNGMIGLEKFYDNPPCPCATPSGAKDAWHSPF